MVQSGVVQFLRSVAAGVVQTSATLQNRVRKVKVKNLTEKLLPSWPTALLPSKCCFFSGFVFKPLLAADCVFDASRVSFA